MARERKSYPAAVRVPTPEGFALWVGVSSKDKGRNNYQSREMVRTIVVTSRVPGKGYDATDAHETIKLGGGVLYEVTFTYRLEPSTHYDHGKEIGSRPFTHGDYRVNRRDGNGYNDHTSKAYDRARDAAEHAALYFLGTPGGKAAVAMADKIDLWNEAADAEEKAEELRKEAAALDKQANLLTAKLAKLGGL